jgi:hypothetical protein
VTVNLRVAGIRSRSATALSACGTSAREARAGGRRVLRARTAEVAARHGEQAATGGKAFIARLLAFVIRMHTLERSTARRIFQLDESSKKVQVDMLAGERGYGRRALDKFAGGFIHHRNLLVARVKITSYNLHRSAPFSEPWSSTATKSTRR